jgi:hypothetical protein
VRVILCVIWFASAPGCSGDDAVAPPVALCRTSAWTTLFQASYLSNGPSQGLAYADHTLYFSAEDATGAPQIFALADADGAVPIAIAPGLAGQPVVEDDHLSFVDSTGLSEVPLPGGAPRTILVLPDRARHGPLLVAPHDLYWSEPTPDDGGDEAATLIRKMSRPEGVATDFATLPSRFDVLSSIPSLALSDSALLVAGDGGKAFAIPFDGTPARPFPSTRGEEGIAFGILHGLDATGATWSGEMRSGSGDVGFSLKFGPSDGSPSVDFWSAEPPANFWPRETWLLNDGDHLVAGSMRFQDNLFHPVLFRRAPNGRFHVMACDPKGYGEVPAASSFHVPEPPVGGDGALYIVAFYANGDSSTWTWSIVRVVE